MARRRGARKIAGKPISFYQKRGKDGRFQKGFKPDNETSFYGIKCDHDRSRKKRGF